MMPPAMILSAGLGTRLKPLTDKIPKALVAVNGKTLLERAIIKMQEAGISDIVINTFHFHEQVIHYLEKNNFFGLNINYTVEEELLDSGGGIKNASKYLKSGDCFIVFNVDIICDLDLAEMVKQFRQQKALALLAVSERESSRKLLFDEDLKLCGWRNSISGQTITADHCDTDYKAYAFSGVHVISTEIFNYMPATKVFSIIDLYLELMHTFTITGLLHSSQSWFDAGKLSEIERVSSWLFSHES